MGVFPVNDSAETLSVPNQSDFIILFCEVKKCLNKNFAAESAGTTKKA
jgi:hypothetical protein